MNKGVNTIKVMALCLLYRYPKFNYLIKQARKTKLVVPWAKRTKTNALFWCSNNINLLWEIRIQASLLIINWYRKYKPQNNFFSELYFSKPNCSQQASTLKINFWSAHMVVSHIKPKAILKISCLTHPYYMHRTNNVSLPLINILSR